VADVWLETGDGTAKSFTDWRTLLIVGEGRGANKVLWSTSASCETDFSNMYKSATGHVHYCGYWALDITNTLAPAFKWRITPSDAGAPYLGDPWSKIMIHRVKINGNEKWVGFFGGGHQLSVCSETGCDKRGKGFFVIDLASGNVLWSYTRADNAAVDFAMPAPPAMVDTDLDGFTDTAYIGDLGGNIWRFKFCSATDSSSCNTSNWTASRLYERAGGTGAIYAAPAVAKDPKGNLWLYWGTGDRLEPISVGGGSERIYAVKDTGSTVTLGQLENVTSSNYADTDEKKGWYMILAGQGEKVLAEPVIFGGVAYFTSYIPTVGGDVCQQSLGTARLYALGYLTAASATGTDSRSIQVGYGIPTAPIISARPGGAAADLYVTVSSATYTSTKTVKTSLTPPMPSNRSNMLFWRDRRVQ
jgi:type IV pilus assembly protein PilY1